MQPSGLPSPEILATFFAGPLGKRPNRSLVEMPVPVVIWRSVGDAPLSVARSRENSMIFQ